MRANATQAPPVMRPIHLPPMKISVSICLALATGMACSTEPGASTSREVVFFVAHPEPGIASIYRMNPDGSDPKRLTSGNFDFYPALSPNGRTLAFTTYRSSPGTAIFLYDIATSTTRELAHPHVWAPSWSADGSAVAFTDCSTGSCSIWSITIGTGDKHLLVDTPAAEPRLSPTSNRLAFTRNRTGSSDIYIQDLGGGTELFVAEGHAPAWSPDGENLVFTTTSDTVAQAGLYTYNVSSKTSQYLLTIHDYSGGRSAWSPTGRHIMFECSGPLDVQLCVLDLVSHDIHLVPGVSDRSEMPVWGIIQQP
jgi:Tol biopolymer transport system component